MILEAVFNLHKISCEKTTQRNPAFCEVAFMVSIVYARKHCILKEVGYHLNIDFFSCSDLEHEL